jgi:hypothetical protein
VTVTAIPDNLNQKCPGTPLASYALTAAAVALAGVGITINGYYSRSLGSSDVAGMLFLATGVASDGAALAGWAAWGMTFAFAVLSALGFASTSITDTTMTRSQRVTPAITAARDALADAVTARNRECKVVGRFCRLREETVTARQGALDQAMTNVAQGADPQTDAARKLVSWLSAGKVTPSGDDFSMLRLALLALLPQLGGVLLMVGRAR